MNDYAFSQILTDVKNAIGITGTYQDATLTLYIKEAMEYLSGAGVKEDVINSSKAIGVITRGVLDLWNYGSGSGKLSPYFYQRAIQLTYLNNEEAEE